MYYNEDICYLSAPFGGIPLLHSISYQVRLGSSFHEERRRLGSNTKTVWDPRFSLRMSTPLKSASSANLSTSKKVTSRCYSGRPDSTEPKPFKDWGQSPTSRYSLHNYLEIMLLQSRGRQTLLFEDIQRFRPFSSDWFGGNCFHQQNTPQVRPDTPASCIFMISAANHRKMMKNGNYSWQITQTRSIICVSTANRS